jgi:hypothetical protein
VTLELVAPESVRTSRQLRVNRVRTLQIPPRTQNQSTPPMVARDGGLTGLRQVDRRAVFLSAAGSDDLADELAAAPCAGLGEDVLQVVLNGVLGQEQ